MEEIIMPFLPLVHEILLDDNSLFDEFDDPLQFQKSIMYLIQTNG